MNVYVPSDLEAVLRGLYQSNETAAKLFDHFAGRKNKASLTTAENVETLTGAFRGDAVELLKRFADLGLGTYFIGRRGSPTRIEWDYDIREVGKAAQGAPATLRPVERLGDEEESDEPSSRDQVSHSEKSGVIEHLYQLRADFRFRLSLPADLSNREADRIGAWVKSLPFES